MLTLVLDVFPQLPLDAVFTDHIHAFMEGMLGEQGTMAMIRAKVEGLLNSRE